MNIRPLLLILPMIAALFILPACTETGTPKEEAQDVKKELNEFVMSVENAADQKMDKSIDQLDAEYLKIKDKADSKMDDMNDATKEEINALEARYQQAKGSIQTAMEQAKEDMENAAQDIKQKADSLNL